MATPVVDVDWNNPARLSKYPLDDWFDGQTWKLERSWDYECADKSLISYLRKTALRRKLCFRARIEEPGVILVQVVRDHL